MSEDAGDNGRPATPARLPPAAHQRGPGAWNRAGQPSEKALNFVPSAKRLIRRLRPERARAIIVLGFAIASVSLAVIGPWILGHATNIIFNGVLGKAVANYPSKAAAVASFRANGDTKFADLVQATHVTNGIDFHALGWVLFGVLFLYVGSSLLSLWQGWVLNGVVQRTVQRMRDDVEAKLNRLPLVYYDGQPRGEILSRVTNDIDNIQQSLQQTLSQLINSLLTVLGVLVMMFIVSPLLALIALVTVPISMVVTTLIARRSQGKFIAQWQHTGTLNGHIEEAFTGHELVKVFGRQHEVEAVFNTENEKLYEASFSAQFISGIIMPTMMFIGNLNYVIVAVIGGLRVASGSMSLGDVQAFIQYSRQFTQPLTQVASMANVMQSGVASAERVFELLDAAEQRPDARPASAIPESRGRVEFDGVSFRYVRDRPLIDNLSLVAEPGRTVAIVGPTGAGKTTLVNLIMRFYELDSGVIRLDGVDIARLTRHDLRSRIGMVLQDTWLLGGSIRDNIGYGKPGATEAEIHRVAEMAYVDRFVHSLPDGYDTVIDDEGGNVSAGEKQLITIARAFLSDPQILILDEATSSVDTRTEVLVQQAMVRLRSDRTSFVIAHRLSTIRDADVILVMESGRIVELGTHDSLLEDRGAYYRLYNAQFAHAAVDLA
ncbi:MAG: ABC transporter ATP-binding protein [Mycobacteriales bacterium]